MWQSAACPSNHRGNPHEKEQIPLDPPFSKWEAKDYSPPQDSNNKGFYSPL